MSKYLKIFRYLLVFSLIINSIPSGYTAVADANDESGVSINNSIYKYSIHLTLKPLKFLQNFIIGLNSISSNDASPCKQSSKDNKENNKKSLSKCVFNTLDLTEISFLGYVGTNTYMIFNTVSNKKIELDYIKASFMMLLIIMSLLVFFGLPRSPVINGNINKIII